MKMKEKAEKITCASRPNMNAYNLGLHIFLPARRAEKTGNCWRSVTSLESSGKIDMSYQIY